ncbi:uncharacterized protein Mf [Planococcus citri]|uniref:uncharacterized protein Mf n=1 Tax=Planococcus citri TaxID=170843 RepID=UPI0031F88CE2
MLKQHLDMIGRNEPVQRKAKFWQSYVRALKGTDDMRAPEQTHYSKYPTRGIFRPVLNVDYPTWPSLKSIYDDPVHPSERINVPGYRYLPISRETYGISPRNLYPQNYSSPRYEPTKTDPPFKALNDWNDHLNRLAELDNLFPKKYPPLHKSMTPPRELYVPRTRPRSIYEDPMRALGYNYAGQPIYTRPLPPRPLREMFEPNTRVPISRFVRDPWWWDYPELKPFEPPNHGGYKPSPFYLRDSYLSPVKRTYLWGHHPIRPFSQHYY